MERLRELQEMFGGGPLAAFVGVLVLAVVALFVLLMRSERAHLRTALALAPVARDLADALRQNASVVKDTNERFEKAIAIAEYVAAQREALPPTGTGGGHEAG